MNQTKSAGDIVQSQVLVKVLNCNNISEANLTIRLNSLNIKFGSNGSGKSSIAKAIAANSEDPERLLKFLPFGLDPQLEENRPKVEGAGNFQKVMIFDEKYIESFVFQRDEVLKNSFEIFMNTPEYQANRREFEELLEVVLSTFREDADLDRYVSDFQKLGAAFSFTNSGELNKNSQGYKSLSAAAKLENLPPSLEPFRSKLTSHNSVMWLDWHLKGKDYMDGGDDCPFCSKSTLDKVVVKDLEATFKSTELKNLQDLLSTVEGLKGLLNEGTYNKIKDLGNLGLDNSDKSLDFLKSVAENLVTMVDKLKNIRDLTFHKLKDDSDVTVKLANLKISLANFSHLDSPQTSNIVTILNDNLENLIANNIALRKNIGIQKSLGKDIRLKQPKKVNEFLKLAGYKYTVRIDEDQNDRLILEPTNIQGHLNDALQHLSFGERNALAMALFLFDVLKHDPDLVILDDPVSSFDTTKKYALLHHLFSGAESLAKYTTILFTHDLQPLIDLVGNTTRIHFQNARPFACFLETRNNVMYEKSIQTTDLKNFGEVCDQGIQRTTEVVIKCVYLRRKLELEGKKTNAYEVLSNLLKGRVVPELLGPNGEILPMSEVDFAQGSQEISKTISDFDYEAVVQNLNEDGELIRKFNLTDVGYEKIMLFRIYASINDIKVASQPVTKFVNEMFHIENEYVMQLDPKKFDQVPDYVLQICEDVMKLG